MRARERIGGCEGPQIAAQPDLSQPAASDMLAPVSGLVAISDLHAEEPEDRLSPSGSARPPAATVYDYSLWPHRANSGAVVVAG